MSWRSAVPKLVCERTGRISWAAFEDVRARVVAAASRKKCGGTREAPHNGRAIVLIDEIDVHLHPDWQRRLVALAKKHFPNVQVIATTHSPLIASSLYRHEIRIVSPGNGIAQPWSETFGRSPDEIIQSEVGGLEAARPLAIEEKMVEYAQLVGIAKPTSDQSRRRKALLEELAEIGWSGAVEQVAGTQMPSAEELAAMIRRLKVKDDLK